MQYLDAVKKLKSIEDKYDVMSIKYKGVCVWPMLRIYILDAMSTHKAKGYTSSAITMMLRELFRYSPFVVFKRHDIWNYCSQVTRKNIKGIYEHHVSGSICKMGVTQLTLESPDNGSARILRNQMPEKDILSRSWSRLFNGIGEMLLRLFPIRIENESVIKDILQEYDTHLDYKLRLRWMIAQRMTTGLFLSICPKPKLMVIECYYTNMGTIWAAHKHGIPVVELQHGVLNATHYAYNSNFHSDLLYPDEICVYGKEEYKYFTEVNKSFVNKVTMTGVYILDCADRNFKDDIFSEYREKYDDVIVVAGQTGQEERLAEFIDNVAQKLTKVMFFYIPRRNTEQVEFKCSNVKYVYGVNVYEYLKWCDLHATISSTTGLEANYFRKPVIFCDFDDVAKVYYADVLSAEHGAFYIKTEEAFIEAYYTMKNQRVKSAEIFADNPQERMNTVIKSYLQ